MKERKKEKKQTLAMDLLVSGQFAREKIRALRVCRENTHIFFGSFQRPGHLAHKQTHNNLQNLAHGWMDDDKHDSRG